MSDPVVPPPANDSDIDWRRFRNGGMPVGRQIKPPPVSSSGQPSAPYRHGGGGGGGDSPRLTWLTVEGDKFPTTWAIDGGRGRQGGVFYISCQIISPGEYGAGRAGAGVTGHCRIPRLSDRTEQVFKSYEVLATNHPNAVKWVRYSPGELDPSGFLADGVRVEPVLLQNSPQRGPLFIIRCNVGGALLNGTGTGKTSTPKSKAWVANMGARDGAFHDVSSMNCEVLCYGDAWD